jgi:hypothetical protein
MKKQGALVIAMKENGCDKESAERDYSLGYLTINTGRNGVEYAWYVSENDEWAIDMDGNKLTKDEIEKQF